MDIVGDELVLDDAPLAVGRGGVAVVAGVADDGGAVGGAAARVVDGMAGGDVDEVVVAVLVDGDDVPQLAGVGVVGSHDVELGAGVGGG